MTGGRDFEEWRATSNTEPKFQWQGKENLNEIGWSDYVPGNKVWNQKVYTEVRYDVTAWGNESGTVGHAFRAFDEAVQAWTTCNLWKAPTNEGAKLATYGIGYAFRNPLWYYTKKEAADRGWFDWVVEAITEPAGDCNKEGEAKNAAWDHYKEVVEKAEETHKKLNN